MGVGEALVILAFSLIVLTIIVIKQDRLNDPAVTNFIYTHEILENHILRSGPVEATLYRQSGNEYRYLGFFHSSGDAIRAVMKSFERANIDEVVILHNSADRYEVVRLHHSHRGSSEGKKLGGAIIVAVDRQAAGIGNCGFPRNNQLVPGLSQDSKKEDLISKHFLIHDLIKSSYRLRNSDSSALDRAIEACRMQIELAPAVARDFSAKYHGPLPLHLGFKQLSIIEEKRGNLKEALRLSCLALDQGWSGDWTKRIERIQKRLAKQEI